MRYLLIPTFLLLMTGASRADDLNDLPELACVLAPTPLEREQIGCPNHDVAGVAEQPDDAVRFELSEAPKD